MDADRRRMRICRNPEWRLRFAGEVRAPRRDSLTDNQGEPMRTLGLMCCALVLVACEKPKEQPAADTTAAMAPAPAPPAPAPISLADVAGKWTMKTMPEN